ncbi:MAG: 16S rRNA (uracil(1498)-N(3))-methyltransferase [Alphaproteobacteria bacterium]|nr:16S rRNA (uracil(1498)-N(3))-methyltransferase [Alphaproteobacteria bacterium]
MKEDKEIKTQNKTKIRIWTSTLLQKGSVITLSEDQSHYLCNVMRLKNGMEILCFNARDGEYLTQIIKISKKETQIRVLEQTRAATQTPDIWLMFSPIKKDRMDFLIEKAVELGIKKLVPVITQYGITDKLRSERIILQMVEASQQSERLDVPELKIPQKLEAILDNWDQSRILFFMDERRDGKSCAQVFNENHSEKVAILVGPEGGFSEQEAKLLYSKPFVIPVSLGPRILRAETAVVASLSIWQAVSGDWKSKEEL